MATDRETTIRRAEKLLKQGRLDAAIAEYAKAVEEQPRDWNTVNTLGDLYARAGQVDSAVSQYARVAAHFAHEGFLQKAAALYKKIAKIRPHDESVLLSLADLSEQQGLIADARSCLSSVAEHRRRRGNRKGAAEIVLRLAKLDPTDLSTSLLAARATAELGDTAGAVQRLKTAGHELLRRNRTKEGLRALGDAAALDPSDQELRRFLRERYLKSGQVDRAREFAVAEDDEGGDAAGAESLVDDPAALSALESTRGAGPSLGGDGPDREGTVTLGGPETAAEDSPLVRAERALRAGRYGEGRAALEELVAARAASCDRLVSLGSALVDADPDAAFVCLDVASDAAVAEDGYEAAAATLDAFIRRVPDHVAALMKLIEVSVDGGLDATMFAAQARLADAYLATDRPADARVIAEDLVAREPWQRANIDRLRRSLVALGEGDPDRIIADYLSGASPFALTELLGDAGDESPAGLRAGLQSEEPVESPDGAEIELDFREPVQPAVLADAVSGVESVFDTWLDAQSPPSLLDRPVEGLPESAPEAILAQPAVDVPSPELLPEPAAGEPEEPLLEPGSVEPERVGAEAVLGELDYAEVFETPVAAAPLVQVEPEPEPVQEPPLAVADLVALESAAASETVGNALAEVVLEPAQDSTEQPASSPGAPAERAIDGAASDAAGHADSVPPPAARSDDLDRVFAMFRDEAALRGLADMGAQHIKLAAAYRDIGMMDECLGALEVAAHSPRHRFEAASQLAETLRGLGRTREAVEWFERAAEAPAPGVDAGRRLLYELGKTLTDVGESERALAVFLELEADAPSYRDVAARVRRLSSAT